MQTHKHREEFSKVMLLNLKYAQDLPNNPIKMQTLNQVVWVGPERLHLECILRRCWYCWFGDHTLSSSVVWHNKN
jgi:hypothetical protein